MNKRPVRFYPKGNTKLSKCSVHGNNDTFAESLSIERNAFIARNQALRSYQSIYFAILGGNHQLLFI